VGRKSLAEQRRAEILEAYMRCIPVHGLDAPLEQIADTAGMQRSLIRHYVGNRDALVDEVVARIIERYLARLRALDAAIPASAAEALAATLDYLFPDAPATDPDEAVLLHVLLASQERYPAAKARLHGLFEALIDLLLADVQRACPRANPDEARGAAYSLLCLAMSSQSLHGLGLDAGYLLHARRAAARIVASLEDTHT
jgi:AcrR family transcriptional regulator